MIQSFNTYYTDYKDLKHFIDTYKIQNSPSLLIQIFSASRDRTYLTKLLAEFRELLPDAVLIGSTTDGEIMNGKVSSGRVVLSFTRFEETTLKAAAVEHKTDGYYSGRYLAETLTGEDTKLLIAFADGLQTNGEAFLNGVASVKSDIVVAGGHAGDNFEFVNTFVFTKEGIVESGAVAVSLSSRILHIHTDYSFNWHPVSSELTVTKAEGNRLYEINGKPAAAIYAYYLGKEGTKGFSGIGFEFPLIVKRHGLNTARAVMEKNDDGSLNMAGTLYTDEKVKIGFGNMQEILKKTDNMVERFSHKPSETIFIYSCTARKRFMGGMVESEVLPFQSIAPVAGFFTYGEFFRSDRNEMLNQTITLLSLSESNSVNKVAKREHIEQVNVDPARIDALVHLVNITSREVEETTEKLKESSRTNRRLNERMDLALSGSKTSILDWNLGNNSLYISPGWKEMLGFRDSELPNTTLSWKDRVHKDDKKRVLQLLRRYKEEHIEYFENIHRLRHKKGHWVWVLGRAQLLYDDEGSLVRMVGTHTDITEEKELQLKYSQKAQIVAHIHDSVVSTDLDGVVLSWNRGSEVLFGYSAEEMIGRPISKVYPKEEFDVYQKGIESVKREGEYQTDVKLRKKSGEMVYVSLSLSLLKDENDEPAGMISYAQDISERKKYEEVLLEQEDSLRHQAHYDALTALPNRTLFGERLKEGIGKVKRHKASLALFFIDLDKFKQINDSLGHDVGDSLLRIVAKRLEGTIRKKDTLARLGGDEFTVIMEEITHPEDASLLAEKILKILAEPISIDDQILYISGSIGISLYPEDAVDAPHLLKYADTAMYKAKEEGGDTFQFYSAEMTEFAQEYMTMKTSLRQAVDKGEFFIHYQPQGNLCSSELIGMEALIRWQHPTKGVILPEAFISIAEETGLIIEIDRWMMCSAMEQFSTWRKEGFSPGVLALNLSIKCLENRDFLKELKESLKQYDFKPEELDLEVTEGQIMQRPEEVIAKLNEISQLGINISIDDFGTGYSSLSFLKHLPVNRLKIDQSFVKDLPNDEDDAAIVKAIIALVRSLKLGLVAEGVETQEQRDFLEKNGCMDIQGYFFSHPLPAEEIRAILLRDQ